MRQNIITPLILLAFLCLYITSNGQSIGIGIDAPTASLHVVTTTAKSGLIVNRTSATASSTAAVLISDASDYTALRVLHTNFSLNREVVYIENLGIHYGQYTWNRNTGNTRATARFAHSGNVTGTAVEAYNINTGNSDYSLDVGHSGLGSGILVYSSNVASNAFGIDIFPASDNFTGLLVDNYSNAISGDGILTLMEDGVSMYSIHFATTAFSNVSDVSFLPGYNTGFYAYLEDADGDGFYATNMDVPSGLSSTSSGDGFLFNAQAFTATPTSGGSIYGATFGGFQYGNGPVMFVSQESDADVNAYFQNANTDNTNPVLYVGDYGEGGAFFGFNDNDSPTGLVDVATFAYTGSDASQDHSGVFAYSDPGNGSGYGVYAYGGYVGVYGEEDAGAFSLAAVYANGDLSASGTKAFTIDHPLDPENKMLRHFSIESNEVLNMYRGIATIGRSGRAVIELPEYFDAINKNFSYQLTPIGTARQPFIASEINGNKFEVGGQPGSRVSWTVYANRNDAYVKAHPYRTQDILDKRPTDKGKYLDPYSYGLPRTAGVFYHGEIDEPVKFTMGSVKPVEQNYSRVANQKDAMAKKVTNMRAANPPAEMPESNAGPVMVPESLKVPFEKLSIEKEIRTWDELK